MYPLFDCVSFYSEHDRILVLSLCYKQHIKYIASCVCMCVCWWRASVWNRCSRCIPSRTHSALGDGWSSLQCVFFMVHTIVDRCTHAQHTHTQHLTTQSMRLIYTTSIILLLVCFLVLHGLNVCYILCHRIYWSTFLKIQQCLCMCVQNNRFRQILKRQQQRERDFQQTPSSFTGTIHKGYRECMARLNWQHTHTAYCRQIRSSCCESANMGATHKKFKTQNVINMSIGQFCSLIPRIGRIKVAFIILFLYCEQTFKTSFCLCILVDGHSCGIFRYSAQFQHLHLHITDCCQWNNILVHSFIVVTRIW